MLCYHCYHYCHYYYYYWSSPSTRAAPPLYSPRTPSARKISAPVWAHTHRRTQRDTHTERCTYTNIRKHIEFCSGIASETQTEEEAAEGLS